MLTIATHGPDQPNLAALPFVALKGSVASGEYPDETPEMFLMQEATYLAHRETDLHEIKAVGLPAVGEVAAFLRKHDFRMVVCAPCAAPRGIGEDDLVAYARMGGAGDLARMTREHSVSLTF